MQLSLIARELADKSLEDFKNGSNWKIGLIQC